MSDPRLIFCYLFSMLIVVSCSPHDSSRTHQGNDSNIQTSYLKTALGKKYFKREKDGGYIEIGYLVDGKKHGPIRYYTNGVLTKVSIFNRDSLVRNANPINFEFKTVQLNSLCKIDVPQSWTISDNYPETLLVVISSDSSSHFLTNFVVLRDSLPAKKDFFEYITESNRQFEMNFPKFKKLYAREGEDSKYQGYQFVYLIGVESDELVCVVTYHLINNYVYVVTGQTLKDDGNLFIEYKCLLEEVGWSLKPI